MIEIFTKQIRNKWFSGMTYKCYDHSEEGESIEEAQAKIKELIIRRKWNIDDFVFSEPTYYVRPEKPYDGGIWNMRPKLDYL